MQRGVLGLSLSCGLALGGMMTGLRPAHDRVTLDGEAFSKMRRITVAKRGLSIDFGRPFVAIYLNDPLVTREVHRRTELCIPVMPMRMPLSSNDDSEQADLARVLNERFRA